MSTLTGLAYLLEHASFADKEAREKTEARIKPLYDLFDNTAGIPIHFFLPRAHYISQALDGDQSARVSLGMEKGE